MDIAVRKVGRPSTKGKQPKRMLFRIFLIQWAYIKAREAGHKDVTALNAVREEWQKLFPREHISDGTIKRAKALIMPKGQEEIWLATSPDAASPQYDALGKKILFSFGIGPRPDFPLPSERRRKQ